MDEISFLKKETRAVQYIVITDIAVIPRIDDYDEMKRSQLAKGKNVLLLAHRHGYVFVICH